MKNYLTYIFLHLAFVAFSQDLMPIDSNKLFFSKYGELSGTHRFNYISVEDVYTKEHRDISFSMDSFCINGDCKEISSPIYYIEDKAKDKYAYAFRLFGGKVCIIYMEDNILKSIETFYPPEKEYVEYVNVINEQ